MNLKVQFPSIKGEVAIQHILRAGSDLPTIIFLHDALGAIETWRDFPDSLAEVTGCNYLVYDRLGHGTSSFNPDALQRSKGYLEKEADILLEIIETLGISRPILFGHSDGGSIALITASKRQGNIQAVIVEAAHVFVEPITLKGIRKVKMNFQAGQLRQRLFKYHGKKVDDVFGAWANTWLSDDFQDWNIEALLPNIECPCLILQGRDDEFGTLLQVERMKAGIGKMAETVILKHVGHSPHKENREHVLKTTADFIKNLI